jgi:ubiquinone/menaquinone biosynthesis C-methylase UbiE
MLIVDKKKFIPALRFKWLTPLYDFLIGVTMPEMHIKQSLINFSFLTDGDRVLDFGCGTATLTIMAKEHRSTIKITGIDIDKAILDKATEKINQKNLDIQLTGYDGESLPFEDNSFDRIISCLVFHHLTTSAKQKILAELFRITKSNGQLFIADFGRSDSWHQRLLFNMIRGFDGYTPTKANAKGLMLPLISDAGFVNPSIKKKFKTVFGEVQIFKAIKQ